MTTAGTLTLTDFLLARIAEDEARFRWAADSGDIEWFMPAARLIAECGAKRRIVELHSCGHECSQYDHNGDVDNCTYAHDFDDCSTMRLLALPYADHPDYRPEWAV